MSTPETPVTSGGQTSRAVLRWKIIALVSTLALLFLIASIFVYAGLRAFFRLHQYDAPAILTQVKQLDQLVTVRYSIQRVVGITEPKEPFGAESILLMVQGEALAGVDLASISPRDIEYSGARTVIVALPPAKMLNTFLDEKQTKIWDRHITWWTPWIPYDPDLEHKARLSALEDVQRTALSMGILAQAQKNAECAIQDFLKTLGIDVRFKPRIRQHGDRGRGYSDATVCHSLGCKSALLSRIATEAEANSRSLLLSNAAFVSVLRRWRYRKHHAKRSVRKVRIAVPAAPIVKSRST